MSNIDVVLATFNGKRFLPDLLASLESQTSPVGRILVGDDGSQDHTRDVLEKAKEQGMPIEMLDDADRRFGASGNFSRLLLETRGDYVLLADQDDIWSTTKIEGLMSLLKNVERETGATTPVLAYSDARLVREDGSLLAQSAARHQGFNLRSGLSFRRVLLQNVVPGCTMMFNRALVEAAVPVPDEAVMHDWWLLLVATGLGRVVCTEDALTDYRQHGGNVLGASGGNLGNVLAKLSAGLWQNRSKVRGRFLGAIHQAGIFRERFSSRLSPDRLEELDAFLSLANMGPMARRFKAARWQFHKDGILRSLAFYFSM